MCKALLLSLFSFLAAISYGQLEDISQSAGDYTVVYSKGDYVCLIREHRDADGMLIKRSLQRTDDFVNFDIVDDSISYRRQNSLFFKIQDTLYYFDEKRHLHGISPVNDSIFLVDSTIVHRPYSRTPFYYKTNDHVLFNLHTNGVLFFDGNVIKQFDFNFPFRVADSCMYSLNFGRSRILKFNYFNETLDTLPLSLDSLFNASALPDPTFNFNGLFLFWGFKNINNRRYIRSLVTNGNTVFTDTLFRDDNQDSLYYSHTDFLPLRNSDQARGDFYINPRPLNFKTIVLEHPTRDYQFSPEEHPRLTRLLTYKVNSQSFSQISSPSLTKTRGEFFIVGENSNGIICFSDIDSSGIEPIVIRNDTVEKLFEIGDGMHGLTQRESKSTMNYRWKYGRITMSIGQTVKKIDDQFVFLGVSTTQGLSLFITDGTKKGTGFLAKLPNFINYHFRDVTPSLFYKNGDLYISLQTSIIGSNNITYTFKYSGDFIPKAIPSKRGWSRSIEATTSFSGGGAYSKPYIQKRDNRILTVSSMSRHDFAFFPEVKQSLFQNDWASRLYYAIYDTTGNLLEKSLVVAWRGLVSLTNNDSKVLVFPENHSVTTGPHFDTRQPVSLPQTVVAQYSSDNQLEWELKIERVFDVSVLDIKTDEEGNTYLLGYYEKGNMIIDGFELRSDYTFQYFSAKISAEGKLRWAENISMEGLSRVSFFANLEVSDDHLLISLSEGSPNTSSTCRYTDWITRIVKVSKSSGSVVFSKDIQFTDLSVIYSITESANGNIWLGGWFRGEALDEGKEIAAAVGPQNCPTSGILIGLNSSNGKIFATEVASDRARFHDVTYLDDKLWLVLAERDSTRIQKRNHQGYLEKEYAFPSRLLTVIIDESRYSKAQIIPLNNKSDDFLYFSGQMDHRPVTLTDTFYYQNVDSKFITHVLMKRPGTLLKDKLTHDNVFNFLPDVQNIVLFPNPVLRSTNRFYLRALDGKFKYTSYEIFNSKGAFMQSGSFSTPSVPLNEVVLNQYYAAGIYSIVLHGDGDKPLVLKFIVN